MPREFRTGLYERLAVISGSDGRNTSRPALLLVLSAWKAALEAARVTPAVFCLTLAATLAAFEIIASAGVGAQALAALVIGAWAQAITVRTVVTSRLTAQQNWRLALQPDRRLAALIAMLALPLTSIAAPTVCVLAITVQSNHHLGPVSTWFSLPLLLAPAGVSLTAGTRSFLAAAPACLGLDEPLAESWQITRDRVGFTAAAITIALGPFAVLALLWPSLQPASFGAGQAAVTALLATGAFAAQGGLIAVLYERWRAELRPDMRPSRHRIRRREPQLG
jgi:hypothetical protein